MLWHFASLSAGGAASIPQSSWNSSRAPKQGVRSYMAKSCWNSADTWFSPARTSPWSTQSGVFGQREKKCGEVLLGHPKGLAEEPGLSTPAVTQERQGLFRPFLSPSFLPTSISSSYFELLMYRGRSLCLSSGGDMVQHLVLSEHET